MKVNLDYLKFHSFYCNKKLHNKYGGNDKEKDNYFERIFFDNKLSLLNSIKQISNTDSVFNLKYVLLKHHPLGKIQKEELVNKVIKFQHQKLYDELNQVLECEGGIYKIEYLQAKIGKKERIIFFVYNDIVYPIIFDINHHFYKKEDKDYDNNLINLLDWDYKHKQNELKSKLLMTDELK